MKAIRSRKSIVRLRTNRRHRSSTNVQSRSKSKPFSKNIVKAMSQFSCPELPKPIRVHADLNRVFNQKKQNQICAGCNRAFSAFCRRETATKTRQKKIGPSVRLDPARLVETQRWHCPSVYRCYRPALCGRSSSGLFQSR